MELPDYQNIIFYIYYKDPKNFFVNLNILKESFKKQFTVSEELFYSSCTIEIEEKYKEIEQLRKKTINSAKDAIVFDLKRENQSNQESVKRSIDFWEHDIGIVKNDDYKFHFITDVNDGKEYFLSKSDLDNISQIIKSDNVQENVKPPGFSEDENLHNNIFKSNYYFLFERLFEEFKIKPKNRADLKFIFEKMNSDGFLQESISQNNFYKWLSSKQGLEFEITTNWTESVNRLSLYNNVLENFKKIKSSQ